MPPTIILIKFVRYYRWSHLGPFKSYHLEYIVSIVSLKKYYINRIIFALHHHLNLLFRGSLKGGFSACALLNQLWPRLFIIYKKTNVYIKNLYLIFLSPIWRLDFTNSIQQLANTQNQLKMIFNWHRPLIEI